MFALRQRGFEPFGAIAKTVTAPHSAAAMSDETDNQIDLEAAARRLEAAIGRLEIRLDGLFERLDACLPHEREAEALRLDRARLANDLDAARFRERELQKLADEASEALGAAISEVREALGKV
jgi:hypothetical protein